MLVGKQRLFSGAFCYWREKCQLCKADAVDFFVFSVVKTTYGGGGSDESIQGTYLLWCSVYWHLAVGWL